MHDIVAGQQGRFHMLSNARRLSLTLALLVGVPSLAKSAETAEDFFKGKRITYLIPLGAGSGDDLWARLVTKHWGNHIPGKPTFIVQEMPGAGSLVMTNYLYAQAAKDGTVMAAVSPNVPAQALVGLANANFDATKFGYIGSPETSDHACIVTDAAGVKTPEDAQKKEVAMGGNGPTTLNSYMPPILNQVAGMKFKLVEGYKNVPETLLAMERGEIGGQCARLETLRRSAPEQIKDGKMRFIFSLNEKRVIADLPSVFEYIKNPEDKQLMTFIRGATAVGRPIALPPDVPADRLAALRKSFEDTMKDKDFLADAEKQKFTVTVMSGQDVKKAVDDLYKTPKAISDKAKAMLPQG
jgi:tripartite-type tricarboxylate transporter receptor subunit TctC